MTYAPELTIVHAAGASSGGEFSADYLRLYYRSYAQFLRKHFGRLRPVTTMFWLWWRDKTRFRRYRQLAIAVAAMMRGMRAPLVPEPRLEPSDADASPTGAGAMPSDTAPSAAPSR
jgi:GT2 family glycosyltransferase